MDPWVQLPQSTLLGVTLVLFYMVFSPLLVGCLLHHDEAQGAQKSIHHQTRISLFFQGVPWKDQAIPMPVHILVGGQGASCFTFSKRPWRSEGIGETLKQRQIIPQRVRCLGGDGGARPFLGRQNTMTAFGSRAWGLQEPLALSWFLNYASASIT